MAHALGVSVEGEIGCLGSLETGTGEKEDGVGAEGKLDHNQLLTDPDEASTFVSQTKVDALAQLLLEQVTVHINFLNHPLAKHLPWKE